MDVSTLAGLMVFAGFGAALWLLVVVIVRPPQPRTGRRRVRLPRRAQAAAAVAVLVAIVTRWPVAAAAGAALVWWWPALFGGAVGARLRLERLEALACWTEALKDTVAGAIGLDEAIPATTAGAAAAIRPALDRLTERLRAREPLPSALRHLAVDLDDPSADLVVAALLLNAQLRGPGLQATLAALAVSTRDELDLRRKVEAGRRALRTGVRIIVGTTLGFVGALALLDSAYLRPYDSLTGQLVLAVVAGIFAAAFAWLRALGRDGDPTRLLATAGTVTR
ncbi:MAG TPA: type II secretion system F family protein [Sporichthyaceae bacterium]|jgi:Flp pilus assembly protein TadB|nr:type II secretion system F family protein [Sporichthyaceae bacterium]